MYKFLNLFKAILTIHDGAAAAGGDGGGAASGQAPAAPDTANQPQTGSAKPKVVYGKQDATDGSNPPLAQKGNKPADQVDKKSAFKQLISGEYKDEHAAHMQEALDKRFRNQKATQDRLDSLSPLIDTLGSKYGINDGDPAKIMQALDNDSSFWDSLAEEEGLSVNQLKVRLQLQRENASLKSQNAQVEARQMAAQKQAEWDQQATDLQSTFPNFDLYSEMEADPKFRGLLISGVDVKSAYQVCHFDDIMSGVVTNVGQRAEQAVVNNIRNKGNRPAEAGAASTPGIIIKDDASQFTPSDRREIVRRMREEGEPVKL